MERYAELAGDLAGSGAGRGVIYSSMECVRDYQSSQLSAPPVLAPLPRLPHCVGEIANCSMIPQPSGLLQGLSATPRQSTGGVFELGDFRVAPCGECNGATPGRNGERITGKTGNSIRLQRIQYDTAPRHRPCMPMLQLTPGGQHCWVVVVTGSSSKNDDVRFQRLHKGGGHRTST